MIQKCRCSHSLSNVNVPVKQAIHVSPAVLIIPVAH